MISFWTCFDNDFKMKKLPSPHFFSKWQYVSTLAIESQKHALLVEAYSSRAILHQTEPSLIPMFRLGFTKEISARLLRSRKGQRSWGRVLARNSRNEANIAKYNNFDFRAACLPRSSLRADEIKLWLTPSAKQRRNPCSGLPAVYADLSTHHDWPVKKDLCFVCRKTGNSQSG